MTKPRPLGRSWDSIEDNYLAKMAADGKSASQIEKLMPGDIGRERTRNAIIGRSYRKGFQLLGASIDGAKKVTAARKAKEAKERKAKETATDLVKKVTTRAPMYKPKKNDDYDPALLVGVHGLTRHTCRFPVKEDENKKWLFCGKQPLSTGVYCQSHAKVCFQEKRKK